MKTLGAAILSIIAAFTIIVIIEAFRAPNPTDQAKTKERDAIKLCWQEYERKSIGPAEKQFIAGACEMMEKKFEDKHRAKPCFGGTCAPS